MTPYAMDRATPAYGRGYRDCRDRRPKLSFDTGMFYGHDYEEGWQACWNDEYWDAMRENARRYGPFKSA